MSKSSSWAWRAYGALIVVLSALHYGVLTRFQKTDEGGMAWFRRRLNPALPPTISGPRIWIHAVSAGESKIAALLRDAILRAAPTTDVVLSSTTYSGFARSIAAAGPERAFVMPLDTLAAQRRLVNAIRPTLMVLVESEYWPAQFAAAREAGVPVVVVNATLSERSFRRHSRNPAIARRTLALAAHIHVQDAPTRERYQALGVPAERLSISGNLKLSAPGTRPTGAKAPETVTFGNVHKAEMGFVAAVCAQLRKARPTLRLVLVPRYPQRISAGDIHAAFGASISLIDAIDALDGAGTLVWVRQMGTLNAAYARAAVGVVCGTFAPIGGHDLSEPLHYGAQSVYGPYVSRQRALHATLSRLGLASQGATPEAVADEILRLLDDAPECARRLGGFAEETRRAAEGVDQIAADLVRRAQRD
jgi:3-deoxy-D-manno-octulosonic-acid transferase